MPVVNIATDGDLGVVTVCSGILTGEEFIEAIGSRYRPESDLRRRRYYLTDHSAVDRYELSREDIQQLSEITVAASLINPNICFASVAPSDLAYGLARMWQAYAEQLSWQMRMYRDRTEAEHWLREQVGANLTFR